ncbi:MAG: gamma-glutamyltransferase, partial [Candidatus Brocadiae bacterium]|nr:gamma-glutamyltransferase [Candidatus Brocadiia bacterium]
GPTLLTILNILEGYGLAALGHNSPDYVFLVSMAMKAAFADRNPYMGDPEFAHLPLEWMISKDRAAEWRRHIDAGKPIQVAFASPEPADTTHVSIVDEHGNCVALTHSLGMSSGVITPGLGFMYNDSMVNFNPLPAHANSIAPRKGRTTGMTPTIVYGRTLGQGRGDPQQRTSIGWRHGGDHEGVQAALGSGFGFPGLRQGAERVRSTSQAA